MNSIRNEIVLKTFGKHLAQTRRKLGFTQKELAFKANIEISQVSRMERGLINPTLSSLYAIANSLDVPLGELVSFE